MIFRHVLHLGFSWNSSYKLVKHCTKTYVRTGLGNLICASDEPSELEQILSEIWDICIIHQRHAVAERYFYSTKVNWLTCNRNKVTFTVWGTCFTFSTLQLQNSAGAKGFCNLTSTERSLEIGQVIKMSLKPNERYDLNS